MRTTRLLLALTVGLGLPGVAALADEAAPARIGRIEAVAGSVQYRPDNAQWFDARVNEPVAVGADLHTGAGADAELQLAGVRLALDGSSALRLVRADGDALQVVLANGRIGVHLGPALATKTVEIDLPGGGVWLTKPGDYDITAGDSPQAARIAVFAGAAELGGGLEPSSLVAAVPDPFSEWWLAENDAAAPPGNHLPPEIAGAALLDANGRWLSDAQYGEVWEPSDMAADWAPYRDGVWCFLPPWGWTWVDRARWGFAPSHYGRWIRRGERWAWSPDAGGQGLDYRPAAVAFLGTAGIGLSRPGNDGAAVAWFPLAPGEAIGDGNDPHYRNRNFASAVPRAVFAGGQPVAGALLDLPQQRLLDAPVILGALGIAPTPPAAATAVAAPKKPAPVVAAVPKAPPPPVIVATIPHRPPAALPRMRGLRRPSSEVAAIVRRAPPSTGAVRPGHNRQHFAAARGVTGSWRMAR